MNRQRKFEIICVVALIIFIAFVSADTAYSNKTAEEVAEGVVQSFDVNDLVKVKKNRIKEEFGMDLTTVDSCVYYASESVMNVSELMIIKLKEDVNADEIMNIISVRLDKKQTLFEGYAPEQSALLKDAVLKQSRGFVFYCVGEEAHEAFASFRSNVR